MHSPHQPATEPNRDRPARAGHQHPARHLAFRGAAPQTGPARPRMRRRARGLPAAGRLRSSGVAVLLAAPLLAGTASATAASPAANAAAASARNPSAPHTAAAATPARFPDTAPRKDRAASGERAAHAAARYPRAFIEWKLSAGPTPAIRIAQPQRQRRQGQTRTMRQSDEGPGAAWPVRLGESPQ
jgi:hypothetical protein